MKPKLILCLALVLGGNCPAAIIFPKSAEEYCPIAYQETLSFYHTSHFSFPTNVQISNLQIAIGHKWYSFNYQSVLSGKILSAASTSSRGWEYLMMSGTNMIGMMELGLDDKNHWEFDGSIIRGLRGQPDPIWVALQKAEKLPQIKKQDYEFRFLAMGSEFQAVWLHGKRDDIIIPIFAYPSNKWKAYQPYSESEMIKLLRSTVEYMLKVGGVLINTNAIPGRK